MRVGFTVLAMLLSSASIAQDCPSGSPDPIVLVSWTPTKITTVMGEAVSVDYVFQNTLGKGIRMVDASVFFDDALGKHIGGYEIGPDVSAGPGDQFADRMTLGAKRLASANPSDIIVRVCTDAVIYADGTKETFAP